MTVMTVKKARVGYTATPSGGWYPYPPTYRRFTRHGIQRVATRKLRRWKAQEDRRNAPPVVVIGEKCP